MPMSARSIRSGRPGAGVVSEGAPLGDEDAARSEARSATGRAAAYFYSILRLVPNVERGECFNAGVVLFSRSLRFLGLRTALDAHKLAALAPGCDPEPIARQLTALRMVAEGSAEGGPIARLDRAERFHWLTAPSSTMIQPSPVHTGLTSDPASTLDRLFEALVHG